MDREFRYILQWFGEWSEIQREDFVPVLLECLACESSDVATADAAAATDAMLPINGNVLAAGLAAASLADKPMSLFQCRVSETGSNGFGSRVKRAVCQMCTGQTVPRVVGQVARRP